MKRNWIYGLLLLGTAIATYFIVFRKEAELFDEKEANFRIKDSSRVTALFLVSKRDERITLKRSADGWVVNDSFRARKDAVEFLMDALLHQKAEQPVPNSYHDYAITKLSTNSTKIEVYEGEEKTDAFYVSREPGECNVTYMLQDGAQQPYIVKLPLQNTFLGIRYFTALSDWRDRKIMYQNAAIEQVKVSYKDSLHYSFELDALQKTVRGNQNPAGPVNLKRVESYVRLLDGIFCTGFENQNRLKDTIIQHGHQLATVIVKRQGKSSDKLVIYFRPPDKGSKAAIKLGNEEYDFDSFFAYWNDRDFLLLNRQNSEKMLRSFPEFFAAD